MFLVVIAIIGVSSVIWFLAQTSSLQKAWDDAHAALPPNAAMPNDAALKRFAAAVVRMGYDAPNTDWRALADDGIASSLTVEWLGLIQGGPLLPFLVRKSVLPTSRTNVAVSYTYVVPSVTFPAGALQQQILAQHNTPDGP